MSNSPSNEGVNIEPVVSFQNLALKYGKTLALDHVTLDIPARKLIGMIGPDGVGKSTLLSLVTGAHAMQEGDLRVLGGDMRDRDHRNKVCPKIAYMPQGLGKNLYSRSRSRKTSSSSRAFSAITPPNAAAGSTV